LMPSNTDRLTDNVTLWQKFPECQIFNGLRMAALLVSEQVGGSRSARRMA
jgi:hypothetical protein